MGLDRELAPISEKGWSEIEDEARDVLAIHLAGRRLMDFVGPLGWDHSAIDLGDVEPLPGAEKEVLVRRRRVRPLIELRVPFTLRRSEIERIDRGAREVDLDPVRDAAKLLAATEDAALFDGFAEADIPGLLGDAEVSVGLPENPEQFPEAVTEALALLRQAGVDGPYALVLGPHPYRALDGGTTGDGGYPLRKHVQRLVDEPIVWAPSLRGGLVLSRRGGDFRFVCGRDVAIGYLGHDDESVRLYLEESFSAELATPEAVVPLLAPPR